MKNEKKTKILPVRLTPEEHKRLKIEAAERNMTMAQMVKQALILYNKTYNIGGDRE